MNQIHFGFISVLKKKFYKYRDVLTDDPKHSKVTVSKHNDENKIEIQYADGTTVTYLGNATVWHRLPNYERAGTMMEGKLCSFWERWKHEKDSSDVLVIHLNKV